MSPTTGELHVREGKGRQDRIAYATNGAKTALDAWMQVRAQEPGALFWPADGRGRALVNRRMSDHAILFVLRKRAREAKVAPFTPHDLRGPSSGISWTRALTWPSCKQRLAGHASVQTTAREPFIDDSETCAAY